MDSGREPDHREVQIVDLPGKGGAVNGGKGVLVPSWLKSPQSPRQRSQRLIMIVALGCAALLIMLSSTADVSNMALSLIARIFPVPAAPPPLAVDQFYVQGDPPWGQLIIDGHAVAHLPAIATDPPLRLTPGHHTLQWRAAPFVTQSCILTVPADFSSDTCIDNNSAPISEGRYVLIVSFLSSLKTLPPEQRAALTNATQAALNGQQSTTTVRTGEYYALPPSCRITQPMPPQLAPCYAVARQPLKATLSFRLDANAVADLSCDSPEPQQPCAFSTQDCHLFCSVDVASSAWVVGAAVRAFWTFTTLDGQIVARDVPDNPLEEDFVLVQIAWDRAGWQVTPLLGGSNGSLPPFGYPTCQPVESVTNLFGTTASALQWNFSAGSVLADGCVAEATLEPELGATPIPSARGAYCLYRFGVILAVNSLAHRDWPYLPLADAYEQALAQRDIS